LHLGYRMRRSATRILRVAALALAAILAIAQLVPYGRNHTNPAIVAEPNWNEPATRELARRACFDCHSNQSRWPWYSHVAPISWVVQHDVDEGREVLNFSEWHRSFEEAGESAETVLNKEMPPSTYLVAHPEARLTPSERKQLADGLNRSLGAPRSSRAD
jgi:hypothetical protein